MTDLADASRPLPVVHTVPTAPAAAAPRRPLMDTILRTAEGERRFHADPRLADISLAMGAVSVIAFWSFGFGALLGLAAVVTGALSTQADEPNLRDSAIAIVTGAVGLIAGSLFLMSALPNM